MLMLDSQVLLSMVRDNMLSIKSRIQDTQTEIATLEESKANDNAFVDFVTNNRDWLAGVAEDLLALPHEDRKRVAESLIPDKVKVNEGADGESWNVNFRLTINHEIFQAFALEGKIRGFKKNVPDHFSAPRPNPLEQGQNLSRL
jgi:hypothetical protein